EHSVNGGNQLGTPRQQLRAGLLEALRAARLAASRAIRLGRRETAAAARSVSVRARWHSQERKQPRGAGPHRVVETRSWERAEILLGVGQGFGVGVNFFEALRPAFSAHAAPYDRVRDDSPPARVL